MLLQLMQNCFPMLPNPLEQSVSDEGVKAAALSTSSSSEISLSVAAVGELYTHLCNSKKQLTLTMQGVMSRIYFLPGSSTTVVRNTCLKSLSL